MSLDSINENSSTGATTGGICLANSPHLPSKNNKGIKATIVVRAPNVTGVATSCVPCTAASSGSIPVFSLE